MLASRHGREDCPPDDPVLRELPWLRPEQPARLADGRPRRAARDAGRAAHARARAARRDLRLERRRRAERRRSHAAAVGDPDGSSGSASTGSATCTPPTSSPATSRRASAACAACGRGAMRAANRLPGPAAGSRARPLPAAVCWNSEWVRAATPVPAPVRAVHEAIVIPSNARTAELARCAARPSPAACCSSGRLEEQKGAWVVVRALARAGRARRPGRDADARGPGRRRRAGGAHPPGGRAGRRRPRAADRAAARAPRWRTRSRPRRPGWSRRCGTSRRR